MKRLHASPSLFLLFPLTLLFAGLACRRSAPAGTGHLTLIHDGLERTYLLHVPPAYDAGQPLPLVLALHGGGGDGEDMISLTEGLNHLADQQGFLVAYPEGVEKHWNDGRAIENWRAHAEDIDDVGYLQALVEHIAQDYPVDRDRVYAMGISNGAQMSYRLACEAPETFAAIAAVASSMSGDLFAACAPASPVSALVMNGTDDPLVPWGGGTIRIGRQEFGEVISTAETVAFWVAADGCGAAPLRTELSDADPEDGTRVWLETYAGCASDSDVAFYTIQGGGHTWPGGLQYLPESIVGLTSRDVDANQAIWQFLAAQVRSQ
jgi:polyhydroxybutyrate depolymerase